MSFDELQRAFFDDLYTYRIPVALGSIVAVIVVLVVAWRAGWLAAARRHPGRSATLLAIALAVGLPLTYYLASPIWLRTELIEPDAVADVAPGALPASAASLVVLPTAAASLAPASSAAAATAASAVPTAVPAPSAFAARTVTTGQFHGTDDFHFGRGTAKIVETGPGSYSLRLTDFSVRNGPDLFVYLSPSSDDYAADALELGRLKATDGAFSYALPAGADPAKFRSALVWCKQFSHLFAVAQLSAG
jgi:hypothetical protein